MLLIKTANPKNKKSTAFIIPHFSSKADFQKYKITGYKHTLR